MTLITPDLIIDREIKIAEYPTLYGKDILYRMEGVERYTHIRWSYIQIARKYANNAPFRLQPYGYTRITETSTITRTGSAFRTRKVSWTNKH